MNVHSSREDQLLDAAIRLASKVGADGFSMKALAAEADLAVGTAYRYFNSREALLARAYCRCLSDAAAAMSDQIKPGDAFAETYRRVWMALYHYCFNHPEATLCRAHFDGLPSAQNAMVQAHKEQQFAPVAAWIQQAIDRGDIKDLPHPVIVVLSFEACFGLARLAIQDHQTIDQALLEQVCQGTLSALCIEKTS